MTDVLEITQAARQVVLDLPTIQVVEVSTPGPQGPAGTAGVDPRLEPIQQIGAGAASGGTLTLDYSLGGYVQLAVTQSITTLAFTGWQATGLLSRLTLETINQGSFNIAGFANVIWQGGQVPVLTPNGKDIFVFFTVDGGTTIYGNVVGQSYS